MNIHHEQQQSYTGYAGNSQEPQYDYPPHEQQYTYTTTSGQPYGQPVQVFVQFTQRPQPSPQPFDGSRIAAALSYAFGWLSGLLFFLFSDGNRYVRFHALQSLLFFGGINVFDIIFIWSFAHFHRSAFMLFMPFMPYLGGLAMLFFLLLNFVAFIGWFVALFQAARGTYFKLPVVGEIVTRLLQSGPPDMPK